MIFVALFACVFVFILIAVFVAKQWIKAEEKARRVTHLEHSLRELNARSGISISLFEIPMLNRKFTVLHIMRHGSKNLAVIDIEGSMPGLVRIPHDLLHLIAVGGRYRIDLNPATGRGVLVREEIDVVA